jgi:hypothetical protein
MFDKFPCFRIKRRGPDGQSVEIEIRTSLIRWLLIALVVVVLLLHGVLMHDFGPLLGRIRPLQRQICQIGSSWQVAPLLTIKSIDGCEVTLAAWSRPWPEPSSSFHR